ncbi:MAG TPA: hypothetical protein DEV72_19505, partial [Ktedonobacter sp.]|nr:hypothetical protein [Ktedonobacter sp.]
MRHFNSHESLPSDDSSETPPASSFVPSTDLETVMQHFAEIKRRGLPYETAAARIELLQKILAQMRADSEGSSEVRASFQHELAIASLEHLNAERIQQVDIALGACEEALQFYTLAHYPSQYASVQVTLGNVYRERAVGIRRDDLERAVACYQEALRVSTLADSPYEYAQ